MMPPAKRIAPLLLLVASVATSLIGQSQSVNTATSKPASGQVERITLPHVDTQVPPGPNQQVYEKNCLICHSVRYVLTQPHFPKAVWQSEVKKMVDAYGASISPSDQPLIVEYLMAVRGGGASAKSPAK